MLSISFAFVMEKSPLNYFRLQAGFVEREKCLKGENIHNVKKMYLF